jgi:hypothetical protein
VREPVEAEAQEEPEPTRVEVPTTTLRVVLEELALFREQV